MTKRILIVEDNADDEALLMRQLKKAGLDKHILVLRDGASARDFLTNEDFDSERFAAVFLDLDLPKVTGLQLLETIRDGERTGNLPVVVMTSSNAPEALTKCKELGAYFVSKPLTYCSFTKAVADTFQSTPLVISRIVE